MHEISFGVGDDIDRESPGYEGSAEENVYDGFSYGVYAGETPPNSFNELIEAVKSKPCDSDIRDNVEAILSLLSSLPNRDEIVKLLSYNPLDGHVLLALPATDFLEGSAE